MTYEIYRWLKNNSPRTLEQHLSTDLKKKLFPLKPFQYDIELVRSETHPYRDYQEEAILEALRLGRGIVKHATGAGKSLEMWGIAMSILNSVPDTQILILVPNVQLVVQIYEDFLSYGSTEEDVQMYSSKSTANATFRPVVITNRQWMENHATVLPRCSVAIVDETHLLRKGNAVSSFIDKLDTDIKFGFTGTLPEDPEDKWNIVGIIGDIIHERDPHELQEAGWLADLEIVPVRMKFKETFHPVLEEYDDFKKWYKRECDWLETNELLLAKIAELVGKVPGNAILIFDHISHGKRLYEAISTASASRVSYIDGSVDVLDREDVRSLAEDSSGNIIVANAACFGTGINIKNIHNIFLCCSGKAATKIIQIIGRGLRTHVSKKKLYLFDVHSNLKYSKSHFQDRLKLYERFYGKQNLPIREILL